MLSFPDSVIAFQVAITFKDISIVFISLKHTIQQDSAYAPSSSKVLVSDSVQ